MKHRKDRIRREKTASGDERPRLPSHGTSGVPPAGSHVRASGAYASVALCGLLLLAVALIFGKTVLYEFINLDDDIFVYENPIVVRGVTSEGIVTAFTPSAMPYPLTLISCMVDTQLYGRTPWGYHLTNVLLHAATSVMLFLALRRMTGNLWASAFAALLFAIHPLRRNGGVGGRPEGRIEWVFLRGDDRRLCRLCVLTVLARAVSRGGNAVRSFAAGKAAVGDSAVPAAVARLLAVAEAEDRAGK